MNERIRELERQATDYYSNGQERIFDRQKFAELIVAESAAEINRLKKEVEELQQLLKNK